MKESVKLTAIIKELWIYDMMLQDNNQKEIVSKTRDDLAKIRDGVRVLENEK